MKKSVLILGAGSGTRMNSKLPKQYILIKDKPIIFHTIEKFSHFDEIIHDINKNHSIIDTNALFLVGKMMDDALLEIDLNYEIKDANTAAKRLLGDNLIGSLIYERVISDALKDELQVCINKKDKIGEFTATLKNNEYHQLTGRLMIISEHRAACLLYTSPSPRD